MHFQKLELQLSNALGFRLGDLLPVEALVFYNLFLCSTILDDDVVDIWNRALATVSSCTFCRPHLPKLRRDRLFFNIFKWKLSSCYSLVHLLPTSSSKSAPAPKVFYDLIWFVCEIELSLRSCAFCQPHLPKALRDRQFFTFRALATVLCTFCLPFSPIEPRTRGNRDPPSATTAASLPEKNTGFCARECFQAWIHAFPISHASQLLACGCHDDWGDDVVAIMVRKLAMTIVRNSEVS